MIASHKEKAWFSLTQIGRQFVGLIADLPPPSKYSENGCQLAEMIRSLQKCLLRLTDKQVCLY
jgi:hypothetical protein